MISKWKTRASLWPLSLAFLAIASTVTAQVKTTTSTTTGTATNEVSVERGTVQSVSGNDLFVKMQDGSVRHFPNVPDSVRVTVDGQQLSIHDLKPGMKLQRTITTTTTPQTVTTVQTVTGKVWNVTPPKHVILTMENGKNQRFTIPDGQKFMVNGQLTDAWGLRKGMNVSATKITEVPETVIDRQRKLTGTMPPPPPPLPADQPILVAIVAVPVPPVASAPAAAPPAQPASLPKTGSPFPLICLLGLIFTSSSIGLRFLRR